MSEEASVDVSPEPEVAEVDLEVNPSVDGEAPEATDAEVEAVVEQIKQLKLKVDGLEIIEDLPFAVTPEQAEYLKKELQMSKMSQKRAQEAADLRKSQAQRDQELNQFLATLKNDPELILRQMGIDTAEFAEAILNKEVEKMALTDEERKIQELETQLRAIKEKEEASEKVHKEAQAQALRDKYAADYEKELMSAMEAGKLHNSPHTINKLVDYMSVAMAQGIDLSFSDLIPMIQEERQAEIRGQVQGMSAEELLSLLSEKTVNDIVLKKMPKEKKSAPPTAQSIKDTATPKEKDTGVKLRTGSAKDFFRNLGREY